MSALNRWWRGSRWSEIRGPVDTILRLLQQEEITRAKARELLTDLHYTRPLPKAPWKKIQWSDG